MVPRLSSVDATTHLSGPIPRSRARGAPRGRPRTTGWAPTRLSLGELVKSTLVLALLVAAAAPPALAASSSDPATLVEAEHAFAHDAARLGTRAAFLRWLAPSAVVFEPAPVNARRWYAARQAPRGVLAWEPEVAVLSDAGDLGWTSGPWQWRADSTGRAPDATGSYVTLWRRQADGSLLAVFDAGTSHEAPRGAAAAPELRRLSATHAGLSPLAQRNALWRADAEYAKRAAQDGVAAAFAASAAPDARVLREGHAPVVGRDAARDSLARWHDRPALMSLAQFVSDSGDLGYTYGAFVERRGSETDSSYYLHVWHRSSARVWELALDLLHPAPPARK